MSFDFAAIVYRTGLVNNEPRAMTTFWSTGHRHEWYRKYYGKWVKALSWGDGYETQLRMTGASSTQWVESDPSHLRVDEEFVARATDNDRVALAQVQNRVLFDVERSSLKSKPPFVLASPSFGPMKIVPCTFDIHVRYLDELPDMELFLDYELLDDGYQLERRYHIPRNVWFPASVVGKPSDSPVFYQLSSSSEGVIQGKIAIQQSLVVHGKHIQLIRVAEYRGRRKEARLGVALIDDPSGAENEMSTI